LEIDHCPAAVESPYGMLDPAADSFPFAYSPQEFPDLAWLIERQYADPDGLVNAWARRFLRRGGGSRTLPLLTAITQAIKADFAYEARDREGTNPPTVTLATRRGACRDFALLMMDAVRSLGLAARFVSGYVYDERTGDATVGGGATHARCICRAPAGSSSTRPTGWSRGAT
jgi:transglutaminase-like putative cysteine protease